MDPAREVPQTTRTPEDDVTGAVQRWLDTEADRDGAETGHIVVSWVLAATVIQPNGVTADITFMSDEGMSWSEYCGLAHMMAVEADRQYRLSKGEAD